MTGREGSGVTLCLTRCDVRENMAVAVIWARALKTDGGREDRCQRFTMSKPEVVN